MKYTLGNYIKAKYLLEHEVKDEKRSEIRAFGKELKEKELNKIFLWAERAENNNLRLQDNVIEKIEHVLYWARWMIIVGMFVIGLTAGFGLLKYSGSELVSIGGFFIVLILLPFIIAVITFILLLIRLLTKNSHTGESSILKSFLNVKYVKEHWLPSQHIDIDDRVLKSLSLEYTQWGSLSMIIGSILALLYSVIVTDIAFGWQTTIDIEPMTMHALLSAITFPWIDLFPNAVPSLELIKMSHYYRLGNEIDPKLIQNAKELGSWWIFLVMSLVVWGALPRVGILLLAKRNHSNAIRDCILFDKNAKKLLKFMDEPYITTTKSVESKENHIMPDPLGSEKNSLDADTTLTIIGWKLNEKILTNIKKEKQFKAPHTYVAGALASREEEESLIKSITGKTIIVVAAWEPPLKDILKFIKALSKQTADEILIYPIGTEENDYLPDADDVAIWTDKIKTIDAAPLGVYNASN